jgi:hypothetical protein
MREPIERPSIVTVLTGAVLWLAVPIGLLAIIIHYIIEALP